MLIKHARFGLYALCLDRSFDNISSVRFSFSSRIYVRVICLLNCIYVCLLIVCSPMLEENKISIYLKKQVKFSLIFMPCSVSKND